jgi:quinolinate synthase
MIDAPIPDADAETFTRLSEEIDALRAARNAVILAHYYQRPAVQEVADVVGDSLALSREAADVDADVIVFCGVRFMAETAALLNPGRTVLLPEPAAGCSMAEMADAESVRRRRAEMPADTAVVCYVNSTAAVKAVSDICCTSSNALDVVNSLDQEHILFVPDRNLASYVAERTDKNIVAWAGHCYVHDPNVSAQAIAELKRLHPNALVAVHPECPPQVRNMADYIGSTAGILRFADESPARKLIVGTEEGILYPLRRRHPDKLFYPTGGVCASMRMTTLASVRHALAEMVHPVRVGEDVREGAERAIRRMLEV